MFRQPTTAVPLSGADIARSLVSLRSGVRGHFAGELKRYLGKKHIFLVNNGTTAFYCILKAIARTSPGKTEVIVPAYTIPNIARVIALLGLTPRLVDIDLSTLDFDLGAARGAVTEKTLAAVPVHLFGFVQPKGKVRDALGGIPVIEDACQCWGARPASDDGAAASFWSLCRGKSFSTYQGGVIGTDSDTLAQEIEKDVADLEEPAALYSAKCALTMFPYALAMYPPVYGLLYPFISRFKSTSIHRDIPLFRYPAPLAAFGLALLKKMPFIEERRRENGMRLYRAAGAKKEVSVPAIPGGTSPGFNHLPLVFRDPARREDVARKLWDKGIDTGRMYLRPLHMIFDLGLPREPGLFPNAAALADGLLTVPTHPYLRERDIESILRVFEDLR